MNKANFNFRVANYDATGAWFIKFIFSLKKDQ